MPYEVKLEVFEGPIDLLLHLITRQRVDIYDVSLAQITEEYLGAIAGLDHTDLETATGFLVVAATLLELKSARLLPGRGAGDEDGQLLEERDLLLARLVECSTFREAGAWLARGLEAGAASHGRAAGLEERFVDLAPKVVLKTSRERLAALAAAALAPRPAPEVDVSHVAPIRVTVRDAIVEVAALLRGRSEPAAFRELCSGASERIDVVVRFLALLELFKAGAVDLVQLERFGDIRATWTGAAETEDVLEEADEYVIDLREAGR
ncbi:MAG: segregation/condensation protein A [Actinomycetota bacterium]|nr:segregation/condensation protein A [Actinomycetota bacterium]